MIEHTHIHGRPVVVAYLDDKFNSVDKEQSTMVKITHGDGTVVFAVPNKTGKEPQT